MKKRAILIGVFSLCCTLICSSCNTIPALCKKVSMSESLEYADQYKEALREVVEKYAYTLIEEEITEESRNAGSIARYRILIDDTSTLYNYSMYLTISNHDGIEEFQLTYTDKPNNESRLRNYDETLIHSFVDIANCISGKEFNYEDCYEFFQKDHSLKVPEGRLTDYGYLSLDFWETWRVSYSSSGSLDNFSEIVGFERVAFVGNTKLSTW